MKPIKQCTCRGPKRPDGSQGPLLGANCPKLYVSTSDGGTRLNPNHGRWFIRVELPARPDGTRQRQRLGPFATSKQASDTAEQFVSQGRANGFAEDPKLTVAELLDWCLDTWWPSQSWAESSLTDARVAVDLYWKPALGHHRLTDLRQEHVLAVIAAIKKLNRDDKSERDPDWTLRQLIDARAVKHGRRLSKRLITDARIERLVAVLVTALNTKVAKQHLPVNPALGVRPKIAKGKPLLWTPPRVASWKRTGKVPGAVTIWTAEMAGQFLDHVRDDRLYPLFVLAINTGMRRGELIALEWSEVDLDERTVQILSGKTENAPRTIGVDQHTAAVLRDWHRTQAAERLAWGPAYTVSDHVFTRENGEPLTGAHASYRFQRLAGEAGLPPTRFHDLRHGVACWLLAANVSPKIIQERLGHASVAFTLDQYAAFLPDQDREAADALGQIISQRAT